MAMAMYSLAIIVSSFVLSWLLLAMLRPMVKLLYAAEDGTPLPIGIVAVWVALGFLQVVGMPFAPWCAALACSLLVNRFTRDAFPGEGWWLIALLAGSASAVAALLGLPIYLMTEPAIIAAAALACALSHSRRRVVKLDMGSVLALAICLAVVAYSALRLPRP